MFGKTLGELRAELPNCDIPEAKTESSNYIDLTKLNKTNIAYHSDGSRSYQVNTGYELSNGHAVDNCSPDGQFISDIDYNGLNIPVINNDHREAACADDVLTQHDFTR